MTAAWLLSTPGGETTAHDDEARRVSGHCGQKLQCPSACACGDAVKAEQDDESRRGR